MSIFASKEEVSRLKERALMWEAVNFISADPYIVRPMRVLNQIEGLAAVYSCEGHMKGEIHHGKILGQSEAFYIMFAVEEHAFPIMTAIYAGLKDRLAVLYNQRLVSGITQMALSFTSRLWPLDTDMENTRLYNVMILRGPATQGDHKALFFAKLQEVLEEQVKNN